MERLQVGQRAGSKLGRPWLVEPAMQAGRS